jgi:S-formylglutathione hydrolase
MMMVMMVCMIAQSVSAFAPIAHPSACAWGQKAFKGYLGDDQQAWKQYDATELIKAANKPVFASILIDQVCNDR